MIETEHHASGVLPLAEASARLGISSDALRMRIRRGKIKGFKRGGRVFVELGEHPNEAERTSTEQQPASRFEPNRSQDRLQDGAPDRAEAFRDGATPESPPEQPLPLVVEFQKVELSRLLRDNARLNQRFDRLMEELSHLREMQQREQVLRQRDQALRQQIQDLLGRLAPGDPALEPPAATAPAPEAPTPEAPTPEAPTPEVPAFQAPAPVAADPGAEAAPEPEPTPLAEAPDAYAYVPGGSGGTAEAETSELAELLEDIGTSLRDLEPSNAEAVRSEPPSPDPTPDPTPAPAPIPAPAALDPSRVEGARRVPDELARPAGDNEANLLEILGRMGPSAEDRRSAARLMKRLLRGRGAGRRREPGQDPG